MLTKEAFTRLAHMYMDAVFRLAFTYLKNRADADDVTQTVLLRLYETKKEFEGDTHVKNWLMRVTVNECRQRWRSPWSKTACIEDFADGLIFEDQHCSDLFDAIMALDRKYRTVIVLHYYEGYGVAEIAKLLGVPLGTVGTRLRRAREQLKRYLLEV